MAIHRHEALAALRRRRDGLQAEIAHLDRLLVEWEAKALEVTEKLDTHQRLDARVNRLRDRYAPLIKLLQEIDIGPTLNEAPISILERANSATKLPPKFWPW